MDNFYNPTTFDQEKYKRTCWRACLMELKLDDFKQRLVVSVATGRKYWPLFSEVIDVNLGINDTALSVIKLSLKKYTHPMLNRFVAELEIMLTDIYKIEISFSKIEYPTQ